MSSPKAIKSLAKDAKSKPPTPRTQALPSPRPPIPRTANANVRQQTRSRYVEPQQRASQPCQGSWQHQRPSAPTTASLRGNRPQNSQTAITDRLPLAPHTPSKTTGPSPATTAEVKIPKGLQQYFEAEERRRLLHLGHNPDILQRILVRGTHSMLALYEKIERNKGYLPWYDWCKVYAGYGSVILLLPIVTMVHSLSELKRYYRSLF